MALTDGIISQWAVNGNGLDTFGGHNMSSVSPSGYASGKIGQALVYDGIDDKDVVLDHDDFSFGDASTDSAFSIFLWAKMTDATNFRLFSKNLWGTYYEYAFYFTAADTLRISLYDNGTVDRIDRVSTAAYTGDQAGYHLYGVTYDGSSSVNGLKLYRDNTRINTSSSTGGTYVAMHNTPSDCTFGVIDGLAGYAKGDIDVRYIWGRALSDGGVAEGATVGVGSDIDLLWNGGAGIELTSGIQILRRRLEGY